jgi:hypothetical protein
VVSRWLTFCIVIEASLLQTISRSIISMGSFNATADNSNALEEAAEEQDVDAFFVPLSVRQTIHRSACILRDNLALFMTMSAVVVIPILLILIISLFTITWEIEAEQAQFLDFVMFHARPLLRVLLLVLVIYTLVGMAIQGAMIRIVVDVYATGKRPCELQEDLMNYLRHYLLGQGKRVVCSIFCYNFFLFFAMLSVEICFKIVLSIVLFLFGFVILNLNESGWAVLSWVVSTVHLLVLSMTFIYVNVSMFAAIPSIVVEQQHGWNRAMQRSWDLVTSRRVFVFAAHACYALAVWLPCKVVLLVVVAVVRTVNMTILWSLFWILIALAVVSMVIIPFHAM